MAEVTEADRALWETLGPAVFHGDMTGPLALATAREAAEKAERQAVVDWVREAAREYEKCAEKVGRIAILHASIEAANHFADAISRGDHRKG